MTPQQKAKQLIEKHWVYALPNLDGSWKNAKQSALISVDEILALTLDPVQVGYWRLVRHEIEKL